MPRGWGATTLMMEAVMDSALAALSGNGGRLLVLTATEAHARDLTKMLHDMLKGQTHINSIRLVGSEAILEKGKVVVYFKGVSRNASSYHGLSFTLTPFVDNAVELSPMLMKSALEIAHIVGNGRLAKSHPLCPWDEKLKAPKKKKRDSRLWDDFVGGLR